MGNLSDIDIEKIIKTIDTNFIPPEGLKKKIFDQVVILDEGAELSLTPLEKFLFEKPLRIAGLVSISISGILWIVLGNDFIEILNRIFE